MNPTDPHDLPEFATSFSKLAALLKTTRSHLHEIRLRDPRFPPITPSGWPVIKVGLLLELRRVEKLTPAQYAAERRESAGAVLADIEGGRVEFGQRTAHVKRMFVSIMQDFDGTEAQAEMIEELTESLLRN